MPAGVAVSVYRIVQEALTNANRHAGPGATVEVAVVVRCHQRRRSWSRTTAAAPPAANGDGGYGLVGMRERATAARRLVPRRTPSRWRVAVTATIPFQATTDSADGPPHHTGLVIRVALVDDQAMIRQGLRMILESEPGITVVGEAADGPRRAWTWCRGPGPTSC